jgi:hypothetical protein
MKKILFTVLLATLNSAFLSAQAGYVGIGTDAPGSKLTVNGAFAANYRSVTTGGLVGADDYYLAYSANANGTLTLPVAINGTGNFMGRTYHFKNTGTATLRISANGTELIDNQSGAGVSFVDVPSGYYAFFISKGTLTEATWELILLSSINSLPTAASNYVFSAVPTSTRQTGAATPGSTYIQTEFNYPQGTVINSGNALNTANGRFTAPTNGYYMFYGSTQFDNGLVPGTPTFGFVVLYLVKNYATTPNNVLVQSYVANPGAFVGTNVSCITYLNAGETVSMSGVASVSSGNTYQVVLSSLYGYKIAN